MYNTPTLIANTHFDYLSNRNYVLIVVNGGYSFIVCLLIKGRLMLCNQSLPFKRFPDFSTSVS